MPSKPYSIEDLHRPATEGRSLHDDASAFYREIMKLQTPIVTVSSKAAIAKAIQAMTKSEAEKFGPLLLNLQVTPLKNLWPASVSQPPPTKEGVLWAAAQADQKAWKTTRCKEVVSCRSGCTVGSHWYSTTCW